MKEWWSDFIPANIKAERSEYNNCICEMCHGTGYVTKISYPITLYHDGKKLSQKKHSIWLCDECRDKLMKALSGSKKGHWIEFTKVIVPEPYNKWEQAWKCSECGYDDGFCSFKYCPECGVEMDLDLNE